MWDKPFDPLMLGESDLAIWCPEEKLSYDLMEVLAESGVRWNTGESPSRNDSYWDRFGEITCYHVLSSKRMTYGRITSEYYGGHEKCTFYGSQEQEEISDEDFNQIIGATSEPRS